MSQKKTFSDSTKRRWRLVHLRSQLRGRRPALAIAAVAPIAILSAACGGPSTSGVAAGSTTTSTTTTTASSSAGSSTHGTGLLAYTTCMRSHGVSNFPDPSSSGGFPKQDVISAESSVSNSQVERPRMPVRICSPRDSR